MKGGRNKRIGWTLGFLMVLGGLLAGTVHARDTLGFGKTLNRGGMLVSHSGRFKLNFQNDGNLVLYDGTQAIWSSGTRNKGGRRLVMQRDGNLVMYGANGPVWATNTSGNPESYLKLQDDGNLVIYRPVWSTGTTQ